MSLHRSLALFLLSVASAYGQQPVEDQPTPVTPPGVLLPGENGVPAAGAPDANPSAAAIAAAAANQPGVPLGQTRIVNDINEPKLSGNQLAGLYRTYTGHRVIVSAVAATTEFSFVQEATEKDSLTFAEAADLLRKAAIIEGFVFVQDGLDPNLAYLTLATGGVRPTQIGIKVYNENDPLPETDAVISYVMSLNYIKPAEAVNTFIQIIGSSNAYGSIAPVPNASAVVITENTSLIRVLIDLKKEIDKPSSQVATRFINVKYADVTEIAATLTELLTAQQSTQATAGIQRAGMPQPAAISPSGAPQVQIPGQAGGSEGGSAEATPVQIMPDPRTNRIFAMGRPVDLLFVENLVREFDIETSEKNFLRRKLRFLKVSEFLPVATDALTRAFSSSGGDGGAGGAQGGGQGAAQGGGGNRSQARNTRQSSQGGRSSGGRNSGSTGANFGGGAGGGESAGGGSSGNTLGGGDVSSAPESVNVGRTFLVADNITNSVVVQGPPSSLEIIERLLDQIDVKPDQVMISTVIGQLTLNDNIRVGLDYLNLGGDLVGRGGNGAGPVLPIINELIAAIPGVPAVGNPGDPGFTPATAGTPAQGIFSPGQLTGGGLQVYGKIGNNLNVYLQALQSKSDFTVLSRPSIFTANNVEGTISSGERIAIPTGSNSFGNGNNASTQIEYERVVLELAVRPLVNSENEITLEIKLKNDELNGTQTIAGGGGNGANLTVPRISTRDLQTTVTVPNNETIVLGGLISAKDEKTKSGIPILSSIPYIGGLFGSDGTNKDRSELMVFIQPSIVSNDRSLNAVQADMDSRYKAAARVHTFADGPGVLPPADAITPVEDKASTGQPPATSRTVPATDGSAPVTIKKRPMGPAHRR
jgi:general secretion pathway protein D